MRIADRFWDYVDQSAGPDGCWPWTRALTDGYGVVRVDGRLVRAHRFAHELAIGPIPDGYQVDHVRARGCTRTECCNPAHLEAVTPKVNSERSRAGEVARARQLAIQVCPQGHEYSGSNLHIDPRGARVCRACKRDKARAAYARSRRPS